MSLKIKYSQGLNTVMDPSEIADGELVQATGVYYKPGDNRPHRIGGVKESR